MTSDTADSSSIEANVAAEARGRRPVWNVPSNGAIEVGPVMGAVSWPALSESATVAKASPKSSSSDSLKSLSDGSASSASPGPLISSPIAKPANSAPSPNPIQNPMPPTRQKSLKRGGSSGGSSSSSTPTNGGVGPALVLPVSTDMAQTQPDMQGVPEPSPRGSRSGGPTQQPHGGGDQHRGYGSNRRGNHGGGSHHNHGNRRDQEWNHHRNAHVQHQHPQQHGGIRMHPRPPPPVSAPFIPSLRSFVGNAMGFPDVPPHMYVFAPQLPPESLRGIPSFVPHPLQHTMLYPMMDQQHAPLLKQIEYYFSNENLCKDVYLRQNMDEQGWVSISLIAGFNRVRRLTNSTQYILDTVRFSTLVEVQGEKIRRRNDWMNWLLIPSNHFGPTFSSGYEAQSLITSDYEAVAACLQNVGLEGVATSHNDRRGSIRGEFQVVGDPTRDGSGQFIGFSDSNTSKSSRSLSRSDTL